MRKEDFTKLGFNSSQATDLLIMMRLDTEQDMEEWMIAVGKEDVDYGIRLMQTAVELQSAFEMDQRVNKMKKFKVIATMYTKLVCEIEADTIDEAWDLASDIDGGDFKALPDGDFEIYDVQEIKE